MVAVIAGNGLGLDNSSLTQLGQTSGGQAPIGQGGINQYLNIANGNLVLQSQDEGLVFDGLPLNLLRTYNSQGQLAGQGWLFGFGQNVNGLTGTLDTAGSTITRTADDGSSVTYVYDTTRGQYVSSGQSGTEDTLAWNAGTSTWTWTDTAARRQETYDASGRLATLTDEDTGGSYSFGYSNGQLTQIVAGDGDTLLFGYDSNGRLASLSIQEIPPGGTVAVTRQQVSYGYDSLGRLGTVTTTLASDTDTTTASYTTIYTYDGSSDRVASVSQSDGTTVSYTYTQDAAGDYQVTGIVTGTGADAQAMTLSYGAGSTTVTDALGRSWTYQYDAEGRLTQVTEPTVDGVTPTTTYAYDTGGNLTRMVDANGAISTYTYDAHGNLLSAEDGAGDTVTYTYNANDQISTKTTYSSPAQGIQGDPGYVAPAGEQTTYYVYQDDGKLFATLDPDGAVSAYQYNADGTLYAMRHYRGEQVDTSVYSVANPPTRPQILSLWQQDIDGFRDTLSELQLTHYTYDARGQLTLSRQWDTLNSGGFPESGWDDGLPDTAAIYTAYSYDANGRLLQTSAVRGADRTTLQTTSYAYDGLGRLISSTDPLGHTTRYVYDDGAGSLTITLANGMTTTQVRNSAGLVISSTQSATGLASRVTSYLYDADGRQVAVTDAMGNTSYTFYDAAGRVAGTVDGAGNIVAYAYDADGQVIQSTQYATTVATTGWISGGALTAAFPAALPQPTASPGDRITTMLYDAAGRVAATIDAEGNVGTTVYDGDGNAIRHTDYAIPLDATHRAQLRAMPDLATLLDDVVADPDDRTSYAVYDADQRVVATIDATGVVTTHVYDAIGDLIATTVHAQALTALQREGLGAAPTLDDIDGLLVPDSGDQVTRTYYDNTGRPVAQVDADGYLTTTSYDETTHTVVSTRYATALTTAQLAGLGADETVASLTGLLGASTQAQVTSMIYNANNQLVRLVDALGVGTTYLYNSVGQLTAAIASAPGGVGRSTSASYNGFGDEISTMDGNFNTTVMTVDALGRQTSLTDVLGDTLYTYYDAVGRVAYTVQGEASGGTPNQSGEVAAYSYDAFGDITKITHYAATLDLANAGLTAATSTAVVATLVDELIAPFGDPDDIRTMTYTANGQLASVIDGDGYLTQDSYDAFGDLTQSERQMSGAGGPLTTANSATTRYRYDARGERVGETDAFGTPLSRSLAAQYDAFGRLISATDGNGNTTAYAYDALGRQVDVSQSVQGATVHQRASYDAFGRVLTQTDALGQVTTFRYDDATRTIVATTLEGVTTTSVEDGFGNVISVVDGDGNTTKYDYNRDDQLILTSTPLGIAASVLHEEGSRVVTTTDANGVVVVTTYDAQGRLLSRTVDPNGLDLVTTYSYDGAGRELSVTDPTGIVTTYGYDADGNVLTQVQDASEGGLNLTTTYSYDGDGNVLTVTVGAGTDAASTTAYGYDALDRLVQTIVDPDGVNLVSRFTYDANDNLVASTDPNGNTTFTVYDDRNEAIYTITPSGAPGAQQGQVTRSWYDADGQLVASRTYQATIDTSTLSGLAGQDPAAYENAVASLATAASGPNDVSSYLVRDADGRVRYAIDPSGVVTETTYNALGQVAGTIVYATPVAIDGTLAAALQAGSAGEAAMTATLSATGETIADAQATYFYYDANGRVVFTVSPVTTDMGTGGVLTETNYDGLNRVASTVTFGALLDSGAYGDGAITASIAAAAAGIADQRVTQNYYDSAGRLSMTRRPDGNAVYTFYDDDGRVSATVDASGAAISYEYDALGRVIQQTAYEYLVEVDEPYELGVVVPPDLSSVLQYGDDRVAYTTYDAAGRVATVTRYASTDGEHGDQVTFTYDNASRVLSVADQDLNSSETRYTDYYYDADGNVVGTLDARGFLTTGTYDAAGNLVQSTSYANVADEERTGDRIALADLIPATSDDDESTTNYYDAYGRLAAVLDAEGYVTQYGYDADGRLLTTTRYAMVVPGASTASLTDILAAVASTPAQVSTNTYDAFGNLASTEDAEGTLTRYAHDTLGRMTEVTVAAGTADERNTSYTYDALGNLATTTDALGHTSSFTYDAQGNRTSVTDALGNITWFVYDEDGRVLYTIRGVADDAGNPNQLGEVVETDYDAFGDVTTTVSYAGTIATADFIGSDPTIDAVENAIEDLEETYNPDADQRTQSNYDLEGNLVYQSDGDNFSTNFTYDGFNELVKKNAGFEDLTTTYTYDALGNLTQQLDGLAQGCGPYISYVMREQDWVLDAFGRTASYTDGDGNTTSYSYDRLDRQTGQDIDVLGVDRFSQQAYDAYGRVVSTTDALGLVTTYAYDDTTRSLTVTSPGGVVTTAVHNREGQVVSTTDPAGNVTTYQYDADGRLLSQVNADGSTASTQYDAVGNAITVTDAAGHVVSYTYDAAGKVLTQSVDPDGLNLVTTYTYDGRGLVLSVVDPLGVLTQYRSDGNGNVVQQTVYANDGESSQNMVYAYNRFNELTDAYHYSWGSGYHSGYQYDAMGRLTTETTDTGQVSEVDYEYDGNGNVISKTVGSNWQNNDTTFYYYDEANELVYTVAATGGREVSDSNELQLSPVGAATQNWYDADGHLVATRQYATAISEDDFSDLNRNQGDTESMLYQVGSCITPSTDDRATYQVYDANGRLAFTIDPTGAVTENRYNAVGQLAEVVAYANPVTITTALDAELVAGTATATDIASALSTASDSAANARATYNYYDAMGRTQFVVAPTTVNGQQGAAVVEREYDADGNLVTLTQYGALLPLSELGAGATTASIGQYLAGISDKRVSHDVYDAAGRLAYSIDAAGDVTEMRYDSDGRNLWTIQYASAIGTPSSWSTTDVAAAILATNPDMSTARATGNAYDAYGNVVSTYDSFGGEPNATYTYDERGLKKTYTDRDGNTWAYDYDSTGNLIDQYSPPVQNASYYSNDVYGGSSTDQVVTYYEYDDLGHVIQKSEGDSDYGEWGYRRTTQYVYDMAGNLLETREINQGRMYNDPLPDLSEGQDVVVETSYDTFGQPVVTTDANGNLSYKIYDGNGQLIYDIDPDGYVTGYRYDALGDQIGVTRYATAVDTAAIVAAGHPDDGDGESGSAAPIAASQLLAALITSPDDRSITTTYDSLGNKTAVVQSTTTYVRSDGSTATGAPTTTFTYDAYGEVTSTSVLVQGDPALGSAQWATTFTYYDELGRQTMSVDPLGYVTTWTYNAFGDIASTTEWATAIPTGDLAAGGEPPALPPAGNPATTGADRSTQFTYDTIGRKATEAVLTTYVDASGATVHGYVTTSYGYDGENRVTTVTTDGKTTTTQYDAIGRVISVTGPQERVLVDNWQDLLEANPSWDLTNAALYTQAAQVVSYQYDAVGDKLVQSVGSTASENTVDTYFIYDDHGNAVASTVVTDGSYPDWTSHLTQLMTYDGNGNLLTSRSMLDGNDDSTTTVQTTNIYDADNQLISSVTQRGGAALPDKSTSTRYNAFGEVVATGNGVVDKITNTYDDTGWLMTATDPATGVQHTYGYNLAGQRVSDSTGVAQTVYTFDLDGNTVVERGPSTVSASGLGTTSLTATYDRWGNVLSSTDARGYTTAYTYNERNQVLTQTGAAFAVVGENGVSTNTTTVKTTAYDALGNVVSITDENGNVARTTYDGAGRIASTTDGAGEVAYMAYDAVGNEVGDQNGIGHITFRNYDSLGRIVQQGDFVASVDGQSRAATWQQAYVLDQNGNRLIAYDGQGSLYLQEGDTDDAALNANYYGYDSQGRVLWSQDAAQRAASQSNAHGTGSQVDQNPANASFEQGDVGWTKGDGWSIPSGYGNNGSNWAARIDNVGAAGTQSPGSTIVNQNKVPVVPGQTISASAQIQQGASDVGHTGAAIQIQWFAADGTYLGSSTGNYVTDGRDGNWNPSNVTGSAPPGAAFACLAVNGWNISSDPLFADDVSWDYVPSPTITQDPNVPVVVNLPTGSFTQQPANPDFEKGDNGWAKGDGWSIPSGYGYNGSTSAARLDNQGAAGSVSPGSTMINTDRVPVVPGQVINASAEVQQGASDVGHTGAAVQILWYAADGTLLGTSTGNYVTDGRHGTWHGSSVSAAAPPGAAYASVAVNGWNISSDPLYVDAVRWDYQYLPSVPTGVVQNTYNYDLDGNLVRQVNADGDTETWNYDAYARVLDHTDLSGAHYTYSYDATTGLLSTESDNWSAASQGQQPAPYINGPITTPNSSTRTYYADGQLASITYADGSSSTYTYDLNGNLVREEGISHDGANQLVHTVTQTSYDSHNRISEVVETNVLTGATTLDETYAYDAAGNRREVHAASGGTTKDAWYTYDGDNRVVVSDGSLSGGQILVTSDPDSYALTYDKAGNTVGRLTVNAQGDHLLQNSIYDLRSEQVRADYAVDITTGGAFKGIEETRTYDADGHVISTVQYYAFGTTLQSRPTRHVDPDDGQTVEDPGTSTDVGGDLASATVDHYDIVGRLLSEQNFGHADDWDGTGGDAALPTELPGLDATSYGSLGLQNEVVYEGPNASPGYDAMGNVVGYQYRDSTGRVDQYQVTYYRKDSYLQATTSGENVSNTPNVQPSTDESIYDTRGDQVALNQHTQYAGGSVADTVRVFAYNASDEIIERRDGTATGNNFDQGTDASHENQHYVYVNGQQIAHYDEGGTLNVLDEVTAFSNSTTGTGDYVVQAGDTLKSMAQAIYGNASLWYVIADANALSGDSELAIGQDLTIPEVTTNANDATTYKPYNPSEIIGSTTPNLPVIAPPPPPPSAPHCNVVAEIIVIAVTIVVTVVTEGATSELLAEEFGAAFASSAVGAGIAVGVGAAAGNAAGQLTGDAEGIHQGFDWGAVGVSGISAGLTAGLSTELGGTAAFGTGELDSSGAPILNGWGQLAQGTVSYAANVGASKLLNEPTHFSWAGIIAGSVSNLVSGQLGPTNVDSTLGKQGDYDFLQTLGARAAGDVTDRETSVAFGDGHVQSWAQIGEDVAGTAIGNALAKPLRAAAVGAIRGYFANQLPAVEVPSLSIESAPPDMKLRVDDLVSSSTFVSPGVYMPPSGSIADGASSDLSSAYPGGVGSAMPLPGHAGSYVNYLVAPEDELLGSVGEQGGLLRGSNDWNDLGLGSTGSGGGALQNSHDSIASLYGIPDADNFSAFSSSPGGVPYLFQSATTLDTIQVQPGDDTAADFLSEDNADPATLAAAKTAEWQRNLTSYAKTYGYAPPPSYATNEQFNEYYSILSQANLHRADSQGEELRQSLQDYSDKQSNYNIATDSARWHAAENADALDFIGFNAKVALLGATAGTGSLLGGGTLALARYFGGGWAATALATGLVGGAAAGADDAIIQGGSLAGNWLSNGATGQSSFSATELGVSTLVGFGLGATLPTVLAGGSKLFNATLARFASTPASAAPAEVGGVVATDDGYAGPLTLSADGTLTPSSTAIDFSSTNVTLTTSPSTADAQAIRQIVAIERGVPGAAASFPQAIDNSVGEGILEGLDSELSQVSGPGRPVAESGTSIVQRVAQSHADSGPDALMDYMSPKEQAAYLANPDNGSRFLGQAVHNATADTLSSTYPGRFVYSRVGFDFLDMVTGEPIELTTFKAVPAHMAKPGYKSVNYAKYSW